MNKKGIISAIILCVILVTLISCSSRTVSNGYQSVRVDGDILEYKIDVVTFWSFIKSNLVIKHKGKIQEHKIKIFLETAGYGYMRPNEPKGWCYMEKTNENGIYRLYIGLALRESVFIVNTINDEVTETDELFYAVRRNDIEAVKERLKKDDVNKIMFTESTALHRASLRGYNQILEILLQNGADTEIGDKYDWTPIERAASRGEVATVELLLKYGANVEGSYDISRRSPLMITVVDRHVEVCKFFLEKGANLEVIDKDGMSLLELALEEKKHYEDNYEVRSKYEEIIDLLRKYGGENEEK